MGAYVTGFFSGIYNWFNFGSEVSPGIMTTGQENSIENSLHVNVQSTFDCVKRVKDIVRVKVKAKATFDKPKLTYLLSHGCRDGKLCLNGWTTLSEENLLKIFNKSPDLTEISISGIPITDATLEYISQNYPGLIKLNVAGCAKLTENGFNVLAAGCQKIEILDTSSLKIKDGGYGTLLNALSNLNEWKINYSEVGPSTLQQIANNKELRVFNAENAYSLTPRENALTIFINSCTRLEKLNLKYWHDLDDTALQAMTNSSVNLKYLDIYSAQKITIDTFLQLINQRTSLRTLLAQGNNFKFDDERATELFNALTKIEKFAICGFQKVSADVFELLKNCKQLQSLDIYTINTLSDEQLAGIINDSNLTSLSIGGRFQGSFLTQINNPGLTRLEISSQLTDSSSWDNFNNPGIAGLKDLNITDTLKNTGNSVFDLVSFLPNLQRLAIMNAEVPFTNEQIAKLPQEKLLYFWLPGTSNLDESALAKFIVQNPHLISFWYVNGKCGPNLLQGLETLKNLNEINMGFQMPVSNEPGSVSDSLACLKLKGITSAILRYLSDDEIVGDELKSFVQNNYLLYLTIYDSNISSEKIVSAIQAKTTMESITFGGVANLDDEAMFAILEICQALNSLGISGTSQVTKEAVDQARQQYPQVTIYYST